VIRLAVTGAGVLCSAGIGVAPVAAALRGEGSPTAGNALADLYDEPLPSSRGHALVDFDAVAHLGRKGTSSLDRSSSLAVVACGMAIADSELEIDDRSRRRIGVALGTTVGSLRSMSDYTRETLVEERPYLVNPLLFPTTVMNCPAGQAAIRYGLQGVNTTIAGGRLAFAHVVRHAGRILRDAHAGAVLAGAVEEFTPHRVWATELGQGAHVSAGECAATFILERADATAAQARRVRAEILSASVGYAPPGASPTGNAIERCARRALAQADLAPEAVGLVTIDGAPEGEHADTERAAVNAVLQHADADVVAITPLFGDCEAASGALQLSVVLARQGDDPARDGEVALMLSSTREGGAAAVVVKGMSDDRAHRE
jgi:3-oxoacyl-[acyl-carrier-protein] synthase II